MDEDAVAAIAPSAAAWSAGSWRRRSSRDPLFIVRGAVPPRAAVALLPAAARLGGRRPHGVPAKVADREHGGAGEHDVHDPSVPRVYYADDRREHAAARDRHALRTRSYTPAGHLETTASSSHSSVRMMVTVLLPTRSRSSATSRRPSDGHTSRRMRYYTALLSGFVISVCMMHSFHVTEPHHAESRVMQTASFAMRDPLFRDPRSVKAIGDDDYWSRHQAHRCRTPLPEEGQRGGLRRRRPADSRRGARRVLLHDSGDAPAAHPARPVLRLAALEWRAQVARPSGD